MALHHTGSSSYLAALVLDQQALVIEHLDHVLHHGLVEGLANLLQDNLRVRNDAPTLLPQHLHANCVKSARSPRITVIQAH